MKKNSFGQGLAVFFVIVGVMLVIGSIGVASEPKCIKAGCDNKQASGSSYCYLHKPYTGSSTSHSSSSYSSKASGSTSKNSTSSSSSSNNSNKTTKANNPSYNSSTKNNTTKQSTTTKQRTYNSYDEGYDDVYMDGDYDYERYNRDRDYANGVEDAIDDLGEEW